MKLLALDTSSGQCSVALWMEGRLLLREELTAREHARLVLPMVQSLLSEAGVSLRALDGIAFGRGPGSFTGVRIAAAVTQGLAAGADLPVLPVSSLRALAAQALRLVGDGAPAAMTEATVDRAEAQRRVVLACMDARMGEIYWALFDRDVRDTAERVSAPAALLHGAPVVFAAAGRGLGAHPAIAVSLQLAPPRMFPDAEPHAREVALLAAADLAAGATWIDAARAQPVYLRNQVTHAPKATVLAPL